MALEISLILVYIRTIKTEYFKKPRNPNNPEKQSVWNIDAPPFLTIPKLYDVKNEKCMTIEK